MLQDGLKPEEILEKILGDFSLQLSEEKLQTQFKCNCSKERVSKALVSLGKKELKKIIDDKEAVELNCHFCNSSYKFTIDELKDLYEVI